MINMKKYTKSKLVHKTYALTLGCEMKRLGTDLIW